jgi:hypothetical protein
LFGQTDWRTPAAIALLAASTTRPAPSDSKGHKSTKEPALIGNLKRQVTT